jgi:branched-chain amino acid transport system permease protein
VIGWRSVGAIVLVALVLPHMVGAFGRSLAIEILIFSLFALSIGVIYGQTGMLSFGHAGYFGVGAYAVALTVLKLDFGIAGALTAAGLVSGLLALVVAGLAVQLRGHYFALITIIVGLILYYVATGWRSVTNAEDGLSFEKPPLFGVWPLSDPLVSYYFFAGLVLLVIFGVWFVLLSPLGRLFRALRENEDRARYLGYSVVRLKVVSFTVSGALAGFAGGLYSLFSGYASSEFLSWVLSGEVVMWAMVGGAASLIGPFLGAALLIWGREMLSSYVINIYPMLVGAIIIASVIFLPKGLAGAIDSIASAWRRQRSPGDAP